MQIYRHFYAETQDCDNSSDELSAEFIDAEVYANTIEPYNPSSYMRPHRRRAPSPATVARKKRAARKAKQAAEDHHRRCCDLWRAPLPNSSPDQIEIIAAYFTDRGRSWTLDTYHYHCHPARMREAIAAVNKAHNWDGETVGFTFRSRETMNDGDRSWFEFRAEGSPR